MKNHYLFLLLLFILHSCGSKPTDTAVSISPTMQKELQTAWTNLMSSVTDNQELIASSWETLHQHYSETHRAYHNLQHIHNMLQEADKYEAKISDKEVILFSIWFHDIIYDPMSKENERQSAELAKQILRQTSLSPTRIEAVYQKILLTIKHQADEHAHLDDRLLIDFDLEILSKDWPDYQEYTQQVRREYSIYPDLLFKKGRKAAMGKFLERETIYQTPFYKEEQEAKARANIKREIDELL